MHDNPQRKQPFQLYSRTHSNNKNSNNDNNINRIKQSTASKQNNFVQCEADKTSTSTTNHPSNDEKSSSIESNITFRQRRLTLNKSSSNEIPKEDETFSSNSKKSQHEQEKYISRRKTKVNIDNSSTNTSAMRILYSTEFEQSEEAFSPNAATISSKHEENNNTTLPFPSHQVGTYSCHGVEPHPYIVYTKDEKPIDANAMSFFDRMFGTNASEKYTSAKVVTVSQRKINQDRGHIIHPYGNNDRSALFGVFDGHGICGEMLAEYTMNAVFEKLNLHPDCKDLDNVQQAFVDIFREIDDEVKDKAYLKSTHSGSTACVVLVHEKKVWAANVGDSRVVSARRCDNSKSGGRKSEHAKLKLKAVDWSKDQNANDIMERSRVIKSGGFVTLPHEEGLPARIWLDKECTQIGLAMSRSIGDHALKSVGVISDPEVNEFKITDQDEVRICLLITTSLHKSHQISLICLHSTLRLVLHNSY